MVPKVTATDNRGRMSVKAYAIPDVTKTTREMTVTEIICFFIETRTLPVAFVYHSAKFIFVILIISQSFLNFNPQLVKLPGL